MDSIISFPSRGKWGNSSYRGNCSGYVQKSLFEQYKTKIVTDPMAGSGTTMDVANDMNIKHHCYDLNSNPRNGIIGSFNAMTDEVPDEARESDLWFWHPPYSSVIGIPYAGSMWSDKEFQKVNGYDPKEFDLGRMDWPQFTKTLQHITMKFYAAMDTGARMCVLMGDIKRKGRLYSMLMEMAVPGVLEQIIIKAQHNCVSDNKTYANKNFISIVHEYILVLKKASPYILDFKYPTEVKLDIRDSQSATWSDIIFAVMQKFNYSVSLDQIYNEIEGHERCKTNPHWKEKIRQTLYTKKQYISSRRGYWCLSA